MKGFVYIFILILIYLVCGARSCNDDGNAGSEKAMMVLSASRDSVKHAFEIDHPTEEYLRAYEESARQKLINFVDYMKVLSDTSMKGTFQEKALELTANLFISKNISIESLVNSYFDPTTHSLNQLLQVAKTKGLPCWLELYQVEVKIPLTRANDSTYQGKLSFYTKCNQYGLLDRKSAVKVPLTVDMYAIRKVKSIGKEQLIIWDVHLGDFDSP